MIIPQHEYEIVRIYRCPVCGSVYRNQREGTRTMCAINHAPGSCCHYGEQEITADTLQTVMLALGEKVGECWASYRDTLEVGSDEWVRCYTEDYDATCLLERDHSGPHEWTPDNEIQISFVESNDGRL